MSDAGGARSDDEREPGVPRAPRHEPAFTRDPRVLVTLVVVLLGFLTGLALLLYLIATDV